MHWGGISKILKFTSTEKEPFSFKRQSTAAERYPVAEINPFHGEHIRMCRDQCKAGHGTPHPCAAGVVGPRRTGRCWRWRQPPGRGGGRVEAAVGMQPGRTLGKYHKHCQRVLLATCVPSLNYFFCVLCVYSLLFMRIFYIYLLFFICISL